GMHGADQVGGEDEGALEHGDDQKIVRRTLHDLGGEFRIASGDLPGVIERVDLLSAYDLHSSGSFVARQSHKTSGAGFHKIGRTALSLCCIRISGRKTAAHFCWKCSSRLA